MNEEVRIALTGFMGVGKSSVARHLAHMLRCRWIDLDRCIEEDDGRIVAKIIDTDGIDFYRALETKNLERVLTETDSRIVSLGGGTWTVPGNREMLKAHGLTSVWLESTFEHCWLNISFSRKDRPLARDKNAVTVPPSAAVRSRERFAATLTKSTSRRATSNARI